MPGDGVTDSHPKRGAAITLMISGAMLDVVQGFLGKESPTSLVR
jgi:hypothetical protein